MKHADDRSLHGARFHPGCALNVCGPFTTPTPSAPLAEIACADPAVPGHAAWSGVKDHFAVVVDVRFTAPDDLAALAQRLGTTPEALLTDTATRLGRTALARL